MPITYQASAPVAAPEYKPFVALAAGGYDFKVIDAEEKFSKAGNQMIELTLRCGDLADGPKVWDYLVFAEKALWKVDQFMAAIGHGGKPGDSLEIDADNLIGETGRVTLAVEKNDKGREVNKVESYVFEGF